MYLDHITSENSQTALSACKSQGDYTLEFCPTQKDFKGNAGGDTKYVGDLADQGKCAAVPLMVSLSKRKSLVSLLNQHSINSLGSA